MLPDVGDSHVIAGAFVFVTAALGVSVNSIVVFWISKLPSMKNAFGRLVTSQAIADLLHTAGFLFYFAPMITFHFMVSVNRALAIFRPIFYSTHFTMERARLINYACWSISFFPSIFTYYIANCRFFYSEESWSYIFTVNPVCNFFGWYYDFMKSVITIGLIAMLDFVTFLKCRVREMVHAISDTKARSRRKDDIRFVTQATLQGFIFLLELLTYFVFANYMSTKLGQFLLTTFAWVAVHALDGIITILFNKEIRGWLRKHNNSSSNVSTLKAANDTHTQEHSDSGHF